MDQGLALVLAAALAAAPAFVTAVSVGRKVKAVHEEVKTLNEKPIGQLAAEDETRRIEAIPHDDRTSIEQRHIDESPPVDPPQGPSR